MKSFLISLFFLVHLALFSLAYSQGTSPYAQQVADIDSYWVEKDYSAILQIIDNRLDANASDAFGLSLKRYYYTYAQCDLQKARTAISDLNDVVSPLDNASLTAIVSGLKDETDGIPLSESIPFSQDESDAIHLIFPNRFPDIDLIEAIALEVDAANVTP